MVEGGQVDARGNDGDVMGFVDWLGGRGRAICADCEHYRSWHDWPTDGFCHRREGGHFCRHPRNVPQRGDRDCVTGEVDAPVECRDMNRNGHCKYFKPTLASTAIRPTQPIPPPPPMSKRCCTQCKTKPRKDGDWLCAACSKKLRYAGHNGPPPPDDWPKPKIPPAPPLSPEETRERVHDMESSTVIGG